MSLRASLRCGRAFDSGRVETGVDTPRLLDARGAGVILGLNAVKTPVAPLKPDNRTLFGPRGAALAAPRGPLVVCDTGHHRLLVWQDLPKADDTPADIVVGQPDFTREGANAKTGVGPATLNMPTGVSISDGVLAVADAWNHRVLLWFGIPSRSNQPADLVLGQPDFTSNDPNRGLGSPSARTLNWCYGVLIHKRRIAVADTGNRRVLLWNAFPESNGAPADLVLGHDSFSSRETRAVTASNGSAMRWPHSIAADENVWFVADAGLDCVLGWRGLPNGNGKPCEFVIGKDETDGHSSQCKRDLPSTSTMSMPYGVCVTATQLIVADTAHSRILGFDLRDILTVASGCAAKRLSGQNTFDSTGDNRWGTPQRDSFCWPYAVSSSKETLVVSDTGNNRVLLWNLV